LKNEILLRVPNSKAPLESSLLFPELQIAKINFDVEYMNDNINLSDQEI